MYWKDAVESLIKVGRIEEASALIRVHHQRLLRENAEGRRVKIRYDPDTKYDPDIIIEGILLPAQEFAFEVGGPDAVSIEYLPTDLSVFRKQFFLEEGDYNFGYLIMYGHGLFASCAEVELQQAVFADKESRRAFFEEAKSLLEGSPLFSEEVEGEDGEWWVGSLAILWGVVDQQLKMLE